MWGVNTGPSGPVQQVNYSGWNCGKLNVDSDRKVSEYPVHCSSLHMELCICRPVRVFMLNSANNVHESIRTGLRSNGRRRPGSCGLPMCMHCLPAEHLAPKCAFTLTCKWYSLMVVATFSMIMCTASLTTSLRLTSPPSMSCRFYSWDILLKKIENIVG